MKSYCSRLALSVAAALLLAGCASTPNISLDRSKSGPIATLALLRVTESQQFRVRNLSGLSALGGAIGGAIHGSVDDERARTFVDAYNRGSVRLSASIVGDLQRDLSGAGMQVSYLPDEFAKLKDGADDYSHIQTDRDAILSVWFGSVGYIADGAVDAPYEPWVVVHVRLLHGRTKQILSQKSYTAGWKAKTEGAVFVPCATGYRFATFEALMADFARSVEALSECERSIVRQASQDLK
jgi:hypothetical protein